MVKRFIFRMFLSGFSAIQLSTEGLKQWHTRERICSLYIRHLLGQVHPFPEKPWGTANPLSLYLSLHFAVFTSLIFSWTLSLFPGEKWKDHCVLYVSWRESKVKSQYQLAISLLPSSYHFSSHFKVNRRLWSRMYNTESRKPEWRECRKAQWISCLILCIGPCTCFIQHNAFKTKKIFILISSFINIKSVYNLCFIYWWHTFTPSSSLTGTVHLNLFILEIIQTFSSGDKELSWTQANDKHRSVYFKMVA